MPTGGAQRHAQMCAKTWAKLGAVGIAQIKGRAAAAIDYKFLIRRLKERCTQRPLEYSPEASTKREAVYQ